METILRTVLKEKEALLAQRGGVLYRVEPGTPVAQAARVMTDANVGCVLVMQGERLAGIFSERDLMRAFTREAADRVGGRPVSDFMTANLITVQPSISVEEALLVCTDKRVRHLPVLEEGVLLGLLSIGDLVRFVVKDKEDTIHELMDYIHGP
ncbi:MAG: CBS domain-containing protein [Lysobacteraceae bacterium]